MIPGPNPSGTNIEPTPERRRKPRIQGPIAASVKGASSDGRTFNLEAPLDNLSFGVDVPPEAFVDGLAYVNVHLDYGLKGSHLDANPEVPCSCAGGAVIHRFAGLAE